MPGITALWEDQRKKELQRRDLKSLPEKSLWLDSAQVNVRHQLSEGVYAIVHCYREVMYCCSADVFSFAAVAQEVEWINWVKKLPMAVPLVCQCV